MPTADTIMEYLRGLKNKHEKIQACMVAKKGLEGLIVFPETFKEDVAAIWEPLSKNLDDMLTVVARYSSFGLNSLYSEMLGYGIIFLILPMSDTALIVFVKGDKPAVEEMAEIYGDIDATRRAILNV